MTHHISPHGHVPVFADRVAELLAPALRDREAVCVDATLGAGGHSEALLREHSGLTVIGIDRDPDALELAAHRLSAFGSRFQPVHAVYDSIEDVLQDRGVDQLDGALFDLGVSSMQLDSSGRGFAYSHETPLDMRMDQSVGMTAAEVVNTYGEKDLSRILKLYGEERFAPRIARAIVNHRAKEPIETSVQLAELVRQAVPAAARRRGGNPSKRTFQALRIEVNAELDALRAGLPQALDALRPAGRVVVLSYHSLEDRIVKREFISRATSSAPAGLPTDVPGTEPTVRWVVKGAQPPSESEIAANPRAASAKLRAVERLAEPGQAAHSRGEDTHEHR